MTPAREARCRAIYKSVEANINKMGADVLELLRNPNATPEHLAQAHAAYSHAYEMFGKVRATLQMKYPGPSWRYPWSYK